MSPPAHPGPGAGADPNYGSGSGRDTGQHGRDGHRQPRGPRRRNLWKDRWQLGCPTATATRASDRNAEPDADQLHDLQLHDHDHDQELAERDATVGDVHAILEQACAKLPWPTPASLTTRHHHALQRPGLAKAILHADHDPTISGCCVALQRAAVQVEPAFRAFLYRLLTCASTSPLNHTLSQTLDQARTAYRDVVAGHAAGGLPTRLPAHIHAPTPAGAPAQPPRPPSS